MARPPEPGSPMEMVYLLVWKMRQNIEFHKSRATMQALLSLKGAEDKTIMAAFDDLREAFFPFDKNEKKDEIKRMKDEMLKEINRGPLAITVLADPNRKKVASRLVRGEADLMQRQRLTQSGRAVNIDAFQKAQRRTRRGVS
jgi:broad specificity phosphatase PhoE